jgi:hypothetical protein
MNESRVFVYFKKNCHGYELKGSTITSGWEAFMSRPDTYLVEYDYSDMQGSMHFFIYEWDKSQKKRRTIFGSYQRQNILTGFAKNVDIPENLKLAISENYIFDEEETENANS